MTSRKTLELLRRHESRNVTFIDPDGTWPIVWERARGCHVWDAEGRRYLDLTAAFGVAAAGHGNPRVVRAGQHQMTRLLHAMGDVHPHEFKARLAQELSHLTFRRWAGRKLQNSKSEIQRPQHSRSLHGKVIFANSGFEAVEAALKTARLATGKPGVIAFEGAYHGLGYGALNTTHRALFRQPFRDQLGAFGHFVPWPRGDDCSGAGTSPGAGADLALIERQIRQTFARQAVGALLAEPVQARGGIRIPPPGFLPLLRRLADEHGALLILDEIYTGFGRTGRWFACEHTSVIPDLICLGKALTGGFPLSACVGRADVMDAAWPPSSGEAIHTSTFLGHPVGCAMALAQMAELRAQKLVPRSARLGPRLLAELQTLPRRLGRLELRPRGIGLMAGIELRSAGGRPAGGESLAVIKAMLQRGFVLLPEGEHAEVISLTPPLTILSTDLRRTVRALAAVLAEVAR